MWIYEKKLQYPVKVSMCNPHLAKYLVEQYGGADGELAAALRYLNQRYSIPDKVIGLINRYRNRRICPFRNDCYNDL